MNKMKSSVLLITLFIPLSSFAFWGDGGAGWANYAVLVKVLTENIKRYVQLREMIGQARNADQYMRALNAGIENSLGILYSLPIKDEGILADIRNFENAVKKVRDVYGAIPKSKDEAMQRLNDMTIGEAMKMSVQLKDYADKQEQNALKLSEQARNASPKGAQRMAVESNSQMLHILSQILRVNGEMLKLQSLHFGMSNKTSKDNVATYQKTNRDLKQSFTKFNGDFEMPHF